MSGHRWVMVRSGGVDVVELGAPVLARGHQARLLEHREVRDGLPRRRDPVAHDQASAQLEERLAVAFGELVEDDPPGLVGEGLEQRTGPVVHEAIIGK